MTAAELADQATRERAIHDRQHAALYPVLAEIDELSGSYRGQIVVTELCAIADRLSRIIHAIESESAACLMREVAHDEARARELALRRALGVAELALEYERAQKATAELGR